MGTPNTTPSGATGVVIGAQASDGRWFQIFLWRAGVPLQIGREPLFSWIRSLGWIRHVAFHRGRFQVVVRLDPERRQGFGRSTSVERVWVYGPWSRDVALRHKGQFAAEIEAGSWDPRQDHSQPPFLRS